MLLECHGPSQTVLPVTDPKHDLNKFNPVFAEPGNSARLQRLLSNPSAVPVKHLISIARVGNALIADEAFATDFFADVHAFVVTVHTQVETATTKLRASLGAGVKRWPPRVWRRPDVIVRITREKVIGELADFCAPIREEAVG